MKPGALAAALGGIGAVAGLALATIGLAAGLGPVSFGAVVAGAVAGAAASPWAAARMSSAHREAYRETSTSIGRLDGSVAAAAEAAGRLAAAAGTAREAVLHDPSWEAVAAAAEAAGDAANTGCLGSCRLAAALGADPAGADAARLAEDLRRTADRWMDLRDDVRGRLRRSGEAQERARAAAKGVDSALETYEKALKELDLRSAEIRGSLEREGS